MTSATMNYPINIIIVEDHPVVRMGLRAALSQDGARFNVAGIAAQASDLWKLLPGTRADVILLDIVLPDESGVEIARKLRDQGNPVRILVLSAETDKETISELMKIGIDGFVSKNVPTQELLTAIEYVADGVEYFGRDISKVIRDIRVARSHIRADFTKRESEILALCAQGLSAKDISRKLDISINTVNSHKDSIFKKLGINSSIELVRWALERGIISL